MPTVPAPLGNRFVLKLDDQPVLLESFDGGNITADVVTSKAGARNVATKALSTLRFEPITVGVGTSMGKPILEWIKSTMDFSATRKDGSIVTVNGSNQAQKLRNFRGALIEAITIPAMDGGSKDAAFFTIKIQPETIAYAKGDGAVVKIPATGRQKRWLPSNFRLSIGDLPCKRVAKIEAFTITQNAKVPGRLEFPNLKVTISSADAAAWEDWFQDFVIAGNNGQEKKLQGTIELLDSTLKVVLGSIQLSQVGIFSLREEKQGANADAIARLSVELYVEKMTLNIQTTT